MSNIVKQFITSMIPDKIYLSIKYYRTFGRRLNLSNPQLFSEKIQWLKLYNRKPIYTTMVDKYAVKEYVANIIGEEYIIPTLGVWDNPHEIDFNLLPNKFVLKTTHGGGGSGVIICKDKEKLNIEETKSQILEILNINPYKLLREWPYKNVKPRIIAEQFLEENDYTGDLADYKFFCFNGKVKFLKVDFDRFVEHHANYYSPEGVLLKFGEANYPPCPDKNINLPSNLPKMIEVAESLSKGFPFLRVDLYNINGNIFFGELTFYPAGGFCKFEPADADFELGKLLVL